MAFALVGGFVAQFCSRSTSHNSLASIVFSILYSDDRQDAPAIHLSILRVLPSLVVVTEPAVAQGTFVLSSGYGEVNTHVFLVVAESERFELSVPGEGDGALAKPWFKPSHPTFLL